MLKLFQKSGWNVLRQRGSHVRISMGSAFETIPMHKTLKKGTERALLKRLEEEK
ncbi:MAG: type II toxin-antitoxin system HicA family toxin [Spirochaetales bacterium]|nr:type II toxin-antitoxin system HicA family toxin [Spirochaetales bacterium]